MLSMLSNKPYLLRAFYEWIADSECTPILVIDANHERCKIPKHYVKDGEIVCNISPSAVRDLKMTNESVEFKASFSGVISMIFAPINAILAVYAEENGEGLFFDAEEELDDNEAIQPPPRKDGSAMGSREQDIGINKQKGSSGVKSKTFLKLVE